MYLAVATIGHKQAAEKKEEEERERVRKIEEAARIKAEGEKILGHGVIQINYTHRANTTGFVHGDGGRDIRVCTYIPPSLISHQRCVNLCHPQFLHNFGYDKDNNMSIYLAYSDTVEKFVKDCYKKDLTTVIMSANLFPISSTHSMISYYVPNIFRNFMKSALKFIIYLSENGIGLRELCLEKHCAVYNQELVFHSLVVGDDGEVNVNANFELVANLFLEFFKIYPNTPLPPLPLDVQDLISTLHHFESNMNKDVLLCHLAVLEVNHRLDRIKSYHELTHFLSSHEPAFHLHNSALKSMSGEFEFGGILYEHWTDLFRQNLPNLAPLNSIYAKSDYTHLGDLQQKNRQLLRFVRHSATHLSDDLLKIQRRHQPRVIVDATVMGIFGKSLLEYHHLACQTPALGMLFK